MLEDCVTPVDGNKFAMTAFDACVMSSVIGAIS
jgi:hypothetical protein